MALNHRQISEARTIISEGRRLGAPRHVIRVALGTWLTENPSLVSGGDRDSSGPFQQRPSTGWGPASESDRTDARQFYQHAIPLFNRGVRGGALAQQVQRSAFPSRYAPNVRMAGSILRGMRDIVGGGQAPQTPAEPKISTETTTQRQMTRAPISTASLPNPIPTALPIAGPILPQGSIAAQLGGAVPSNQTATGQRRSGAIAAPATSSTPGQMTVTDTTVTKKTMPPPPAPKVAKGAQPAAGPVRTALHAAKEIAGRPYVWGGGHGGFQSRGYDCSGAVSYVLHKLGVIKSPLTSGAMGSVLKPGPGAITVFYNAGHTFMRFATKHGYIYWGTSVGDSGGGGLGRHPQPSPGYLSSYKVGHVEGAGTAQAASAVGQATQQQPAPRTSVKVTKGIHTETPRFSSSPILSDLSSGTQAPAGGVLEQSQKPHVPLSVRKIGAGRKRIRLRGKPRLAAAGMQ